MGRTALTFLVAILWAIALISSSALFKGQAFGTWIDAALYLGAGTWFGAVVLGSRDRPCNPSFRA
jgi:hypothetical protein